MDGIFWGIVRRITWRPAIGDPTLLGWATVGLYFLTALLCFIALRHLADACATESKPGGLLFWHLLILALVFLGLNKQLDLQSLMTQIGRLIAKDQGWYEERRVFQKDFVAAMKITGAVALIVMGWWIRRTVLRDGLALVGAVFLISFVVVRAASFHHMEQFLRQEVIRGWSWNQVQEIGGILLIASAALLNIGVYRKRTLGGA